MLQKTVYDDFSKTEETLARETIRKARLLLVADSHGEVYIVPVTPEEFVEQLLSNESKLPVAAQRLDDTTARVEYTLKTPRARDPVLGGAKDKVFFAVWIPDGVKTVCILAI